MGKKLLVPLDGSRFSEHALPYALSMARRLGGGATLELLHVVEPLSPTEVEASFAVDVVERREEQARAYLEEIAGRVRSTAGEVEIVTALREGLAEQEIREHVGAGRTDLVIMATHGRGRFRRAWLGSVTDKLTRRLETPMLLMRPQEDEPDLTCDRAFHRILIPLDGSATAEGVFEAAGELAALNEAEYRLLQVVPPSLYEDFDDVFRRRDEAEAYLGRAWEQLTGSSEKAGTHTRAVVGADVATQIVEFAEEIGADLIAMTTHGRSGLERLLLGSVADKVLRGVNVPILLKRPPL